jgi:uncharacterized membrane protein YdjX (TVP38/TMEM64 family)
MSKSRVLFLVGLVGVLAGAGSLLPVREWILVFVDRVRGMGTAGVLLFFVAYIVSTVAFIPGSILTLAAGFAYGPVQGLLLASPASVAAATAAFVLGRTVLRDWVRRKIDAFPRVRAIDRAVGADSFRLVLLLRLSPLIPFNVLNYALSLTSVSLSRYVVASFVGMLPGTFLYVYLGSLATTAAALTGPASGAGLWRLALSVVGFLATGLVVWLVTRAARRALNKQLAV